jgi:methionine-rich copper-binding protein CopC
MQQCVNSRRLAGGAAAVLIAFLAVAAHPSPASAHAKLVGTSPKASSTVAEPITTVTLTFNEPVKQQQTTIAVSGPDKTSYSEGAARSVDKNALQGVKPLPTGTISVVWQTVSADGHPMKGQFTFTNTAAAATPISATPSASPSTSPSPVAAVPTGAGPPVAQPAGDEGGLGSGLPWLIGAVVVLVALAGGTIWWRRRSASRS